MRHQANGRKLRLLATFFNELFFVFFPVGKRYIYQLFVLVGRWVLFSKRMLTCLLWVFNNLTIAVDRFNGICIVGLAVTLEKITGKMEALWKLYIFL